VLLDVSTRARKINVTNNIEERLGGEMMEAVPSIFLSPKNVPSKFAIECRFMKT